MQPRALVYHPGLMRSPRRVPKDPVEFWLSRLDDTTRPASRSHFDRWLRWLQSKPGLDNITPRELIVRQLEAEDPYEILDLAQTYIGEMKDLRKSSKKKAYSVIKSFFAHNRCMLPLDPQFRIIGTKPPIQPKLTAKDVLAVCQAANVKYRSVIMSKWMSLQDNARLEYICRKCSGQIVDQIRKGVIPVRIDIPGRKSNENELEGNYYTFVGQDAVDALVKYFEEERGWPKEGEPLWVKNDGLPLTSTAFETTWIRLFRRIGAIPKKKGPPGSRYGLNPHEMRDAATTLLHVRAKSEGFDMDCAKFWSGRLSSLDREKYDKFFQDEKFVREQYLIAEKYLNIVSGRASMEKPSAGEMVSMIMSDLPAMEKLAQALRSKYGLELKMTEQKQ